MAILSAGQASLLIPASREKATGYPQRLPNPICWHEGMLLSPQHFQQNHFYWEEQLRQQLSLINPAYWGIAQLSLDRGALLEGQVVINHLVAVMPDGLLVDHLASKDNPLTLTLDFKPGQGAQTIQLAVPIQVPGSASERAEIQRYSSRSDHPRVDENTGENELIMPRLYPQLSLQSGDQVSSRYVGLPLFRVIKPEGGHPQLDPDYAPPLLSIAADHFRHAGETSSACRSLQQRCQALALTIRHKARQLAGLSEDGESLGYNITRRHHRWIRAMVQELAALEQLADTAETPPAALYRGLIRMAGPISELDPGSIPPRFPIYNHDNALPGFDKVMSYILQQVERVNLNYTSLGFDEEQEGVFTLNYDKAWEGKDLLIELRPASGSSREGAIRWLAACRIASVTVHKELMQRRLLGASAVQIESDEKSGIVPANGNVLFRIKANKTLIRPGAKLAIACTSRQASEGRPASIVMHVPHE